MTIGFAIMLDNAPHNFIRHVQLELHQQIGISLPRQTPHITIKSPFEVTEIKAYIHYLEDLTARMAPIDVELKGFGHFGDKVIFLDVMENDELLELHGEILRDVHEKFGVTPHEFEGENIKFHASIAGFEQETTFQQVHTYLARYRPSFRFKASELGIFYYLGEGRGWIVHRRVKMKT